MSPDGGTNQKGWDNFALSLKYQFYQNAEHEAIVSAGIDWDIGHSGSERVGAEPFSTVTPALFFGKGFGDLPESARLLRPFALTGQLGVSIPSRTSTSTVNDDGDVVSERNPNNLIWGFALEYSVPYLQSFVKDMGWGAPFNRMIPIVEFNFSTALNRGASGTTGTINPGILWAGQSVQLGIEAVIPVNARTWEQDRRDCATALLPRRHLSQDDRQTALRKLTMPLRACAAYLSRCARRDRIERARSCVPGPCDAGGRQHGPRPTAGDQDLVHAGDRACLQYAQGPRPEGKRHRGVGQGRRPVRSHAVAPALAARSRPAPIASCGGCSPSTAT